MQFLAENHQKVEEHVPSGIAGIHIDRCIAETRRIHVIDLVNRVMPRDSMDSLLGYCANFPSAPAKRRAPSTFWTARPRRRPPARRRSASPRSSRGSALEAESVAAARESSGNFNKY